MKQGYVLLAEFKISTEKLKMLIQRIKTNPTLLTLDETYNERTEICQKIKRHPYEVKEISREDQEFYYPMLEEELKQQFILSGELSELVNNLSSILTREKVEPTSLFAENILKGIFEK